MEINLLVILLIIIIHWIADFVCQTQFVAENKSKSFEVLLKHTFIYTLVWFLPIIFYGVFQGLSPIILAFIPITFICHTATDYYTSRVNSQLWEKKEVHNFFVSIGFDQVLHYIQLFTTYYLIKSNL